MRGEESSERSCVLYRCFDWIRVSAGFLQWFFRNSGDERRSKLGDDAQREVFWFTALLHTWHHNTYHRVDVRSRNRHGKESQLCYKMFPFDDLLYEEGNTCRTLNIDIPVEVRRCN